MGIANVNLSDTFQVWMNKINQSILYQNQLNETSNLIYLTLNASYTVANAVYNNANVGFVSSNAYSGFMSNSVNSWANVVGISGNTYANLVGLSANNYGGFMANSANGYANTVGISGNAYANVVGTSSNNYAGYMANSVNSYWTSTGFFANTSGSSYNGNLNVPRGNLSLGITNASARLYVQGSAASAINTMPDVATIVPNFGANNNFAVTLAGNRFVDNPYNPTAGQSGVISIVQDTTGGRTLSWSNTWKFQGNVAPTLSTSANAVDLLVYYVRTTSNISAQLINNIG